MRGKKTCFTLELVLVILIIGLGYIMPFTRVEAVNGLEEHEDCEFMTNLGDVICGSIENKIESLFMTVKGFCNVITIEGTQSEVVFGDKHIASIYGDVAGEYTLNISNMDFDSQSAIEGTKLELYDSDGNMVYSWASGALAECISLNKGKYWIKEVMVSDNYVENTEDFVFSINEDGSITNNYGERIDNEFLYAQELAYQGLTEDINGLSNIELGIQDSGSISVWNRHIDTTIKLTELDSNNGNALKGAVFGIFDKSNDELVYTSEETNENGVVVLYKVPLNNGEYYIKEIKAVAGRELFDEREEFVVNGTGSFELTVANSAKLVDIDGEARTKIPGTQGALDLGIEFSELAQTEYLTYIVLCVLAIVEIGCLMKVFLR